MVAWTLKKAKRVIVAVIGGTVLAIGIAMIVLPGPAILVIPLGLGILATEFVWARHLLYKTKGYITRNRFFRAKNRGA
ncbi:MAG: PGPGW domain-containing protein [Geobacteraceae bacterium]